MVLSNSQPKGETKVEGTNGKLFIWDAEIGTVQSWKLFGYPVEEVETLPIDGNMGSITFDAIYDPISPFYPTTIRLRLKKGTGGRLLRKKRLRKKYWKAVWFWLTK